MAGLSAGVAGSDMGTRREQGVRAPRGVERTGRARGTGRSGQGAAAELAGHLASGLSALRRETG